MRLPIVGGVDVAHGCGDAAFSHHRVRFAEQRFANHADTGALRESFYGGAKTGAPGANDEHIVFVRFVFGSSGRSHRIRMSFKWPEETRRI